MSLKRHNIDALNRFGRKRAKRVRRLTTLKWGTPRINARLLLAIGLRETWLENIVSHGAGDDRGVWQLNDFWNSSYLASIPGCRSGTWGPTIYDSCLPKGRVPTLKDGLKRAVYVLRGDMKRARRAGVPWGDRVRVAVAAYNAGFFRAHMGYREGDVDKYTTGRDYSVDVLDRRKFVKEWL